MSQPPKKKQELSQCVYNEFIKFVLDTISSKDYLEREPRKIHIHEKIFPQTFEENVKKQQIKPGIYPIKDIRYSKSWQTQNPEQKRPAEVSNKEDIPVHFFGVRREQTLLVAGNGYEGNDDVELDSTYSIGLGVQRDGSHGLCQTFALMFYHRKEGLLQKGKGDEKKYFKNVEIGLKYLQEYTKEKDSEWDDIKDVKKNMIQLCKGEKYEKERDEQLNRCKVRNGGERIRLSLIIKKIILSTKNKKLLKKWYDTDPEDT